LGNKNFVDNEKGRTAVLVPAGTTLFDCNATLSVIVDSIIANKFKSILATGGPDDEPNRPWDEVSV